MCCPELCFNPCFDGSVARGHDFFASVELSRRFNPCFDGSVARGEGCARVWETQTSVSILVLMEV